MITVEGFGGPNSSLILHKLTCILRSKVASSSVSCTNHDHYIILLSVHLIVQLQHFIKYRRLSLHVSDLMRACTLALTLLGCHKKPEMITQVHNKSEQLKADQL